MNKSIIIGRLTRDPELRTTGSGVSVCNFTVAVDRRFSNRDGEKETDFIPVVAWKSLAELCHKYLVKGSRIAVCGSIQVRSYEGNDGNRRQITEIVADEVEFLTPKENGDTHGGNHAAKKATEKSHENVDMSEIDEDLPF